MNTTFESLTKGAKDCYNYYIASKGSNNRQALSNARVFIEYIPKLGILEFCQKYYNNDLFNILTDRNHQLIFSKSDKQNYIVEMSDINKAKTYKTSKFKTNAYQLRQDGFPSVQIDIDNSFITENYTYSTHSSGLFSILSSLIGLHTNSPLKRIRNIENNFKALYSECNKATHPSDDAEIDDAATEVYDNLDNAIEKFIRFIDKNKILPNTKAFLKETVERRTDKSQAKIETTPPKSNSNTISITTPESETTSNNRVIIPKPTQSNNNNKAKSPTNTDLLFDNLFVSFGNYPSKAKERERDNDRRNKRREILEIASDLRDTFLGVVLCVPIILLYAHMKFESPMIMYIITICGILLIPFAYFLVIQFVNMLFYEKEFFTKPFIHQAEKFHKICVPDDNKWALIRYSPSLVTAIIAIVILFFTNNAIIPVLIGLFGATCSAYCCAFFQNQLLKSQTIYYPKPTHWISTFITALITFSIPAVIYLLFFA